MYEAKRHTGVMVANSALLESDLAKAIESKDTAYIERNMVVCALSKVLPSWLGWHSEDDTEWDDEWRNIVLVQLPTGQASWHIHEDEISHFDHLKQRATAWDGHTTAEKHARIHSMPEVSVEALVKQRDAALARVAELEKRGAVDVSDRANKDQRKRIDALCKTMSVKEYSTEIDRDDVLALLSDLSLLMKYGNPSYRTRVDITEKLDALPRRWRKHSRDVRRITRQELLTIAGEPWCWAGSMVGGTRESWIASVERKIRAIGFEVEA